MNILSGNDIGALAKINHLANIIYILFGLLSILCGIIVYMSGTKLQILKDAKLAEVQNESDVKIAQANSVSETAKVAAAQADMKAADAILGAELARESASKANERTEMLQNQNKQLDLEQSKLTNENVKLKLELEKEAGKRQIIQEHLSPREFGNQATLGFALRAFAGMNVEIKYAPSDEAKFAAEQLAVVLDIANWKITSLSPGNVHRNEYGIIVGSARTGVSNPQDHSQQAGEALHKEFENLGLMSRILFASNHDGGEFPVNYIEIIIGFKPRVEFQE